MVSIADRISYMERVNESPKIKGFHHFLLGKEFLSTSKSFSESDEQFFKILASIQSDDKTAFGKIYDKKSKSNPSKDSSAPFVNDDYLVFCLIVAITKFSIDKTWIKRIVSIRNRTTITITFENILNENYSSTSNQVEVVLMFLHLCKQAFINNNLLNITYKSITENTVIIESRNDFQILCAFSAFDLIIYQKEATEGNEVTLLKNFNKHFKTRIKYLSWALHAIIFLVMIYVLLRLPNYSPEVVSLIENYNFVFTLLGVSGFTFLGNQIPFIKNKSQELLMRLFGYPKELLRTKNN